jgi:hypothetical protein
MRLKNIIPLFFITILLTSFSFSVSKVVALDETFYSGNNILFYSDQAQSCTTTPIAQSGNNKGNIYNFLVSKGLNALQASAVVGNLMQESGPDLNPKALNSSSGAYGIAQWLGGRKTNLMKKDFYTQGATDPSKELQVQMDYLWEELQGPEKRSYEKLTTATTTDVKELAVIFGEAFERYGSGEEGKRATYAEEVFKEFGGSSVGPSLSAVGCGNTAAGNFVYYSQKDEKWANHSYGRAGNIGPSGCGPTSLAMIVATLKDKTVTPIDTADLGVANNSDSPKGTIHAPLIKAASEKWGFKYQEVSNEPFDKLTEALKSGSLVYMGGQGEAPFTSGGHVIVLRGVGDDGKIIVGDPYRGATDTYDQSVIEAGRGTTFIISK